LRLKVVKLKRPMGTGLISSRRTDDGEKNSFRGLIESSSPQGREKKEKGCLDVRLRRSDDIFRSATVGTQIMGFRSEKISLPFAIKGKRKGYQKERF